MATLREIVWTEEKQPVVLKDCQNLLDSEVKRKSGVSGFAVKAGYKLVKTFKSGFLTKVLQDLIPEFCDALEPLHKRHLEEGKGDFASYMMAHEDEVSAALLSVTDGKAEKSTNKQIKKMYAKLRPAAERNVADAIPGLARVLQEHYA
ncbi:MAG: hypothetical protein KC561_11585 [Myxococcales bacterium]|nr:hypothetical protein [Myxococcales bacterium]